MFKQHKVIINLTELILLIPLSMMMVKPNVTKVLLIKTVLYLKIRNINLIIEATVKQTCKQL